MPRQPESRGTCACCGEVVIKRNAGKHLEKCAKRLEAIQAAEAGGRTVETLWHLRVQDAYRKSFWLDLEMNGSAALSALDHIHTEDEMLPLINSPRLGVCGYSGPADPPY